MRFASILVLFLAVAGFPGLAQKPKLEPNNLAPFVPSPQPVVDRMLELAGVKPGEMVYDLGCGDGRILVTAVQKFQAKAVGIELNQRHAATAEEKLRQFGLLNDAKVIRGNMLDVDISPANVVTLYLLTLSNDMLRPKFEKELKPGTRVVSLNYRIRDWKPIRDEKVSVHHRDYTIYLYEVPKR